jgi:hypothetical protein
MTRLIQFLSTVTLTLQDVRNRAVHFRQARVCGEFLIKRRRAAGTSLDSELAVWDSNHPS